MIFVEVFDAIQVYYMPVCNDMTGQCRQDRVQF